MKPILKPEIRVCTDITQIKTLYLLTKQGTVSFKCAFVDQHSYLFGIISKISLLCQKRSPNSSQTITPSNVRCNATTELYLENLRAVEKAIQITQSKKIVSAYKLFCEKYYNNAVI